MVVLHQWGVLVTGGFIVGAIALYEHLSGKPISGSLLWIAIIASLFIAFFLAWRKERLKIESLEGGSGRLPMTPKDLVSVFSGRTTTQGNKISAAHVGKWIDVSGSIQDVRSQTVDTGGSIVTLKGPPSVFMRFEKKWDDWLSMLRPGETITGRGQITEVERHNVWLKNCELTNDPGGESGKSDEPKPAG